MHRGIHILVYMHTFELNILKGACIVEIFSITICICIDVVMHSYMHKLPVVSTNGICRRIYGCINDNCREFLLATLHVNFCEHLSVDIED